MPDSGVRGRAGVGEPVAARLTDFAAALRRAGVRVGTGQVLDAARALACVGVERRDDVREALHATLITRREDRIVFDALFELLFRDRASLERALAALLPELQVPTPPHAADRRTREALRSARPRRDAPRRSVEESLEIDATFTASDVEVDRSRDFEQMSADELAAARRAIARMATIGRSISTRRRRAHRRGDRIDVRRTLRASVRSGAGIDLVTSAPRTRAPALVMLCDVSGSMECYSRILLHFAHTLVAAHARVAVFAFGTRLTNVTRALENRDADVALEAVGRRVRDWAGGTRIASSLRSFNRDWSRRLLGQGAVVLLVTDGLERDEDADIGFESDRLRRSCRRLVWLNPLLRYRDFEPRARGVRALLSNVDEHRPVHNLESLEELVDALRQTDRARPEPGR